MVVDLDEERTAERPGPTAQPAHGAAGPADEHASYSEHIVEITQAAHERNVQRRSLATLGVAVCLALAAVGVTASIVDGNRASEAEVTSEALKREQLRDGWQTLAAVAAADARGSAAPQTDSASSATAPSAPPAAPSTNVIIVTVPSATAANSPPQQSAAPATGSGLQQGTSGAVPPAGANAAGVPVPVPFPALGGGMNPSANTGLAAGTNSGAAAASAASAAAGTASPGVTASPNTPAVPPGTVAASSATPAIPPGTVAASSATPALPSAAVPSVPSPPAGSVPPAP